MILIFNVSTCWISFCCLDFYFVWSKVILFYNVIKIGIKTRYTKISQLNKINVSIPPNIIYFIQQCILIDSNMFNLIWFNWISIILMKIIKNISISSFLYITIGRKMCKIKYIYVSWNSIYFIQFLFWKVGTD